MIGFLAACLAVVAVAQVGLIGYVVKRGQDAEERARRERDAMEVRLVNRIIALHPAEVAALDREQARRDNGQPQPPRREPIVGLETGVG